ncbi:Gfo/Idh/MocA family oxidoreductase [Erythrobacter westpacificensis]|uniref:Gfo/Idh/MocA family oxidoreductase n=2 Tax=Erythrobacter westpacificensis TaxID=1055231 RepID=A0ABP9K397_9SPHN
MINLAGAFDLRAEAIERFIQEFDAEGFETLEDMLASSNIDAVYVATPHALHASQAIAAMESSKHVLVEKPMATSVAECAAMAKSARKTGKILVVGPSHGFDEQVRKAAALVASRQYGAVRMITTMNFTDFMYRPRRPEELDDNSAGGVIYSQAAHQIDVVRRIVAQDVTGVRAVTGNWDQSRKSVGAYTALMTFAGGAAASMTYSGYGHYDSDELLGWIGELGRKKDSDNHGAARRKLAQLSAEDEIRAKLSRTYGMEEAAEQSIPPHHEHFGFIMVSCEGADLKLMPNGIEVYGDERREFIPLDPPVVPRKAVVDEFLAGILGEKPPVHDGDWGLVTTACCEALALSGRTGSEIDPSDIIMTQSEKNY